MENPIEIPKQFDHKEAEPRISKLWEEARVSHAEIDPSKKPFCVVIPPPNVTGILHMGHVLDNVPQDVMTRWHRMRNFCAVWIPGTDHAGIATQNVVKRQLEKEGIDYRSLGREKFLERVWSWKEKHGSIIINQLKRLGCSCDWERERFTMDDGLSEAVLEAFITFYNRGLIYKGKRMINWCTICGTALANDEVEYEEKKSNLWHIRYPLLSEDGKALNEHVVVATTRPETMLGDTAVAVHPEDERYKSIVGRYVLLPLQNRKIPVIADKFVDPSFGTGVVKITPGHDPNDYTAGLAHKLPIEVVIGLDGKMTVAAGQKYAGLDRFVCRKKVVEDLETQGHLEKIEPYNNAVAQCYRCNSILEPQISDQWFVKMRPLADKAKQAVLDGRIRIIPDSEKHDYYHWMDTIQDWCISRQLWWGHRIPVYYCGSCDWKTASKTAPAKCGNCGSSKITQDEDVLDTWFSSQLWPFSTLGWPKKTPELDYWYPNTWLMSGRDILFFWDVKMIMAGLELMGDVPFRDLALHGLVRDDKGRKLSKSLGNSPDPLSLFEEYGTDAVRGAIALRYPMGRQDTKLTGDFYKAGQGLITKLWNASRLLLMSLEGKPLSFDSTKLGQTALEDRWILSRLRAAIEAHDSFLAKSDFSHAIEAVNTFFWDDYCDWYLEIIKPRLKGSDEEKNLALSSAFHCLRTLLKLFHPYLPFVTEELWQSLGVNQIVDVSANKEKEKILAASVWPDANAFKRDEDAERRMQTMMSIVRGVRDVRANLQIGPKEALRIGVLFADQASASTFASYAEMMNRIGFFSESSVLSTTHSSGFVPFRFQGGIGYVNVPEGLNVSDIKSKLTARIDKLAKGLKQVEERLANPTFFERAPAELIEENKSKANEYRDSMQKLQAFHDSL